MVFGRTSFEADCKEVTRVVVAALLGDASHTQHPPPFPRWPPQDLLDVNINTWFDKYPPSHVHFSPTCKSFSRLNSVLLACTHAHMCAWAQTRNIPSSPTHIQKGSKRGKKQLGACGDLCQAEVSTFNPKIWP